MGTYVFKVAPDYTIAYYVRGGNVCVMDEWTGRKVEDFAKGMEGRGYVYTVDRYELSRGKFEEHTWTTK